MSRTTNAAGDYVYRCAYCGQELEDHGDSAARRAGWSYFIRYDARQWCCSDHCLEYAKKDVLKIRISQIVTNTQTRAKVQTKDIERYKEMIEEGAEFPPIEVVKAETITDAPDEQKYYVIDGNHRLFAVLMQLGSEAWIDAISIGDRSRAFTYQEAVWLAAAANQRHGIPRTKDDIKHAVRMVLETNPEKSDTQIAAHIGGPGVCSEYMVRTVRQEMTDTGSIEPKQTKSERVEKALDDPANAGKSNREIARDLNVDEGTVRKARKSRDSQKIRTSENELEPQPADVPSEADPEAEALDRISAEARDFLKQNQSGIPADDPEDFDAQARPTINKVTNETRRVKPEIEKPKEVPVTDGPGIDFNFDAEPVFSTPEEIERVAKRSFGADIWKYETLIQRLQKIIEEIKEAG